MTKVKKEKVSEEGEEAGTGGTDRSYQELIAHLNPIAQPLASKKLSKKLYKCVKKAAKVKNIRRGVKEVQKFINKGEKGIVVMAGDTLPIDVYSHLPVMCEDRSLPYAYIPSKVWRFLREETVKTAFSKESASKHALLVSEKRKRKNTPSLLVEKC
uniref:H/ACA ribonucleoprotein complex subunit 2 n=1 Tax=Astatotilapia calliptera TaxID=8154 RepID=A0AAX7TMR8_ASTCA